MTFHPIVGPVLLMVALLAALVLLVMEAWRPGRRKAMRLSALIVALLGIAIILVRPAFRRSGETRPWMVLTSNYNRIVADSLAKATSSEIIRLPGVEKFSENDTEMHVADLSLNRNRIAFVLGDGLPTHFATDSVAFHYFPSATPTGPLSYALPIGRVGQPMMIQGEWNGESSMVYLKGPGGAIDSCKVENGKYSFRILPRTPGGFMYELTGQRMTGTIPVTVMAERKIRALLLQHYPFNEIRALKNVLADQKCEVIMRTQVSNGVFQYEAANTARQELRNLSSEKLESFDLIVMPASSIEKIPQGDWQSILAHTGKGAGLAILLDGFPGERLKGLAQFRKSGRDSITVRLPFSSTIQKIPGPIASPTDTLRFDVALRSIEGEVLTASQLHRQGRIGWLTVPRTWQWWMEGLHNDYTAIWMDFIGQLQPLTDENSAIQMINQHPLLADHVVKFSVISSRPPEIRMDDTRLPMEESPITDGVWSGTFYSEPGWHSLTTRDSTRIDFYTHSSDAWPTIQLHQQQEFNRQLHRIERIAATHKTKEEEVSPLLGFFLFLLGFATLWMAPKW